MGERLSSYAVVLSLLAAGCAAKAPPTVAIAGAAPPPAATLPRSCDVIKKALPPLNRLRSQAEANKLGEMEPTNPGPMATELSAIAASARSSKGEDAEMVRLVNDMDARFSTMAARVQDFEEARATAREDDAKAALAALLRAAGDSDAFLATAHRRCDDLAKAESSRGRLPPEVIQAVVRSRFRELQRCYEAGLMRNPSLKGRVSVRFVITRNGSVIHVANAENIPKDAFDWSGKKSASSAPAAPTMPDPEVVSCVISRFQGLVFLPPVEGLVTVTYPIMFAPGE